MKKAWALFTALSVIFTNIAVAEKSAELLNIGYYVDDKNLKIEEISDKEFILLKNQSRKNFGVTNNSIWLKFTIRKSDSDDHLYLDTGSSAEEAVLFYSKLDGSWIADRTGTMVPMSKKNIETVFPVFKLDNCCSVYYLKFRSGYNIKFRPNIIPEKYFVKSFDAKIYFNGIFAGIMVALILYNLFIYVSTRDNRYLYYLVFMTIFLAWSMDFLGFSTMLWLKEHPWLRRYSFRILNVLMVVSAVQLSKRMMTIKYYYPRINKILNILQLSLLLVLLPASFFVGRSVIYYRSSQVFSIIAAIIVLVVAILLASKKIRQAYFFLASIFLFVIGALVYILMTVQILPPFQFGNYIFQFTIAAQGIIFSFGLADRINIMNREIEQQNIELIKADELKDEFLSKTSHELRTPLNGIIGISESMIDGKAGHVPQEAINKLALVIYSGKRLANMIDNILDASKIKFNDMILQKKPVNLFGVINIIKQLSENEIKKKGLDLTIKIDQELNISGDESRINQIFQNLLDNAIKYSDNGCIEITASKVGQSHVDITVKDQGIGIEAENFDKIFNKFEQVRQNDTTVKGSGLGLYITKGICELHGGQISVHSQIGKGSEFIVRLPMSDQVANKDTSLVSVVQGKLVTTDANFDDFETTGREKSFEVWAVDDDDINLISIESMIQHYSVKCFNNVSALLDELKVRKPDLVLLDIMMPGIDGYEACKYIRQKYDMFELPIIFLSAKHMVKDKVHGFEVGGNDYITKPIEKSELLVRIKTQLTISLIGERYVNLRAYANRISEFKNIEDMVMTFYEFLLNDPLIYNIALFDASKIVKRKLGNNATLAEIFKKVEKQSAVTVYRDNNRTYVLVKFDGFSDYSILLEYAYETDKVDLEYLKNALSQMETTKKNINRLLADTKVIGVIHEIITKIDKIKYIRSEGNYCVIKLDDPKQTEKDVRISMNAIKLYIGDETFKQVHRQYLVNVNMVNSIVKKSRKKLELDIGGEKIPVGLTYKHRVEKIAERLLS